jgi:glycosyltransferase involved in cell wall biosynthesis
MPHSVVVSHPTGNANARAAVSGLRNANTLAEFHTSIAVFPGDLLDRLSAWGPLAEMRRRRFDPAVKQLTRSWPWREIGRLAAVKFGLTGLTQHETGCFCIDAVYRSLDSRVASCLHKAAQHGAGGVYAYEDGALATFVAAKALGLRCFYDLPIGHWRAARRLLEPELSRWPEWAVTLGGFQDSEFKLARKDEELRLADLILTASTFSAQTLKDFPGTLAPIKVIPYGFPAVARQKKPSTTISASRPLKLLFVGGLSQRKGIADIFAVADALGKHVELTIVGRKNGAECPALDLALSRHRWISSLPHPEILKLMHTHDVLLFPSLFEGFGLVITEAMSQCTPVITTDRTAGPDLIEHGHNGWLIEPGSTSALQSAIETLLSSPRLLDQASQAAQNTAAKRPWSVYAQELAFAIRSLDASAK